MSIYDAPTRRVTVSAYGSVSLNVRLGPESGPPLLLLHGHPQTHLMWRKVWPALSSRFTLVAPDLRGYGDSDKPVDRKSVV
jgi:haloacetate dehalogenase